jgi:valyl-tRNA synthetase
MNVPAGKKAKVLIVAPLLDTREILSEGQPYIEFLGRVEELTLVPVLATEPEHSSTTMVRDLRVFVLLSDLIDIDKEIARLSKELHSTREELARIRMKLNNASFTSKAPPEVIEKEKDKERLLALNQEMLVTQLGSLKK